MLLHTKVTNAFVISCCSKENTSDSNHIQQNMASLSLMFFSLNAWVHLPVEEKKSILFDSAQHVTYSIRFSQEHFLTKAKASVKIRCLTLCSTNRICHHQLTLVKKLSMNLIPFVRFNLTSQFKVS